MNDLNDLKEIKKSIAESFAQLSKLDVEIKRQRGILELTAADPLLEELRVAAEDTAAAVVIGDATQEELESRRSALEMAESKHATAQDALDKEQAAARELLAGLDRRRAALVAEIGRLKDAEKSAVTDHLCAAAAVVGAAYCDAATTLARFLAQVIAIEEVSRSHGRGPINVMDGWGWGMLKLPNLADHYLTGQTVTHDLVGDLAKKERAALIAEIG